MRKLDHLFRFLLLIFASQAACAQGVEVFASTKRTEASRDPKVRAEQNVVVITGNRFAYPLIQAWIDAYNKVSPNAQIIIESRGVSDPAQYDILVETFEPEESVREKREYVYVARYGVVPVANAKSVFAKVYGAKGLNADLIDQIYFHDIFADQEKHQPITTPFTVYTRLQKAGSPIVFSKYFKHEQKDINGTGIAGSDEHLLKAILRDSIGVSYLPLPVAYDLTSRRPVGGIVIIPVDLNGNDRVTDDEKIFNDLDNAINKIEGAESSDRKNVPVGSLHLSVDKTLASPEAVEFLKWVKENGQSYLHRMGYLTYQSKQNQNDTFDEFASKHGRK